MEPTYATFDQSVFLKEKGFDVKVHNYSNKSNVTGIWSERTKSSNLSDWNTREYRISIPEQWVVVEWLMVNYDIWVHIERSFGSFKPYINGNKFGYWNFFSTPQAAYSEAFDYIKTNNLI